MEAVFVNKQVSNQRPAYLRRQSMSARPITFKDISCGAVFLPAEVALFPRLYHMFTPGKKTDWTGMTRYWNEHAMQKAREHGTFSEYKLKRERDLKDYERLLVQDAARQQAAQHIAILSGTHIHNEQEPPSLSLGLEDEQEPPSLSLCLEDVPGLPSISALHDEDNDGPLKTFKPIKANCNG